MAKHSTSLDALEDITKTIQIKMDQEDKDIVVCAKSQTAHILNSFVLLFYDNMINILKDYKLSNKELLVLMTVLKKMHFGNQISISFSQIADELGMDKGNLSRIKKKLITCKLFVELDGGLYVNPHVIAKGDYSEADKNAININLVNKTAELIEGTNLTPSIGTKQIRARKKGQKQQIDTNVNIKEMLEDNISHSEDILERVEINNPIKKKAI